MYELYVKIQNKYVQIHKNKISKFIQLIY